MIVCPKCGHLYEPTHISLEERIQTKFGMTVEEFLVAQRLGLQKTLQQIAKDAGCTYQTIYNATKKLGLPNRLPRRKVYRDLITYNEGGDTNARKENRVRRTPAEGSSIGRSPDQSLRIGANREGANHSSTDKSSSNNTADSPRD